MLSPRATRIVVWIAVVAMVLTLVASVASVLR
ncbi:MAG: hypothetical protein KatS3mg011_1965 [Acidimicrobiia bacterium]|jgi:hypothetical protein|nr:MAG: hypothetical protein KatS3mg011_1965 [Acidimicrobiia bacterium]